MHERPAPSALSSASVPPTAATRRHFLKTSSTAAMLGAVGSQFAITHGAFAAGDDTLKVGIVGCGGRGSGAAAQALRADKRVVLTAMGDTFQDRLHGSLSNLKSTADISERVQVDKDHQFLGMDAYKKVIDSGIDVVLLTTPPHFRPAQLRYAIDAGKHVFAEKPVAVDAPGVRSVLATCAEAKKKNLSIVSGLCWRYDSGMRATYEQIHNGAVGEILALHSTYNTRGLWMHKRQPEWSDMEWQVRNWLYFTWLSGDFIVEQHVHSLDKVAWAMKDENPVRCVAHGGRQSRTAAEYGHIFDHFSCVFEYESGAKAFAYCRQQDGCDVDVSDYVIGTKGRCNVFKHTITGENSWKFSGKKGDMYQIEHNELFASIRNGKPINNGEYMTKSTMLAIMGRMAAYTGKSLTWEQAFNSKQDLTPPSYEWGPIATPPVAIPGATPFV